MKEKKNEQGLKERKKGNHKHHKIAITCSIKIEEISFLFSISPFPELIKI